MVIIALTLVLFVIALLVNGFTHDLSQKCGLFLISAKLIMMSQERRFGETGGRKIGGNPDSASNQK
jgi:Na+-translocating ferredoxin:NAD+ oxidoreductase RnfE subunit